MDISSQIPLDLYSQNAQYERSGERSNMVGSSKDDLCDLDQSRQRLASSQSKLRPHVADSRDGVEILR